MLNIIMNPNPNYFTCGLRMRTGINWDILVLLLSCSTKQEQVNIINPAQLGHMQTDLPSSEMESSPRIQTCLATVKEQVGRERSSSSELGQTFCFVICALP